MKITENDSKYNREKEIFLKTVILTAMGIVLLALGYFGMGFLSGYFG